MMFSPEEAYEFIDKRDLASLEEYLNSREINNATLEHFDKLLSYAIRRSYLEGVKLIIKAGGRPKDFDLFTAWNTGANREMMNYLLKGEKKCD